MPVGWAVKGCFLSSTLEGCIYVFWTKEPTTCIQGLWWLMSSGDGDRGSRLTQSAASGMSVQMLNIGTWQNTLSSGIVSPPFTPVSPWCIFRGWHPRDRCAKLHCTANREGLCRAEGFFLISLVPTMLQQGMSFMNFPPSTFQATVLTSASIWGCCFSAGKSQVWRTSWSREALLEKYSHPRAEALLRKPCWGSPAEGHQDEPPSME